jgi:hypothetical protein
MAVALLAVGAGCQHRSSDSKVPKPGEPFAGGTVLRASPLPTGCISVTVEHEPDWNCSDEQRAAALAAQSPTISTPAPAASADAPSVVLEETDCRGLAELRRPALKLPYYAQMDAARRNLLAAHCVGPTTVVLVNADGEESASCRPPSSSGPVPGSPPQYAAPSPAGPSQPSNQNPGDGTGSSPTPAPVATADPGGGANEYSTTNTQVRGVDEPDFVKNDAEQVYVLSPRGLHVIDAWPAEAMREIALVSVAGEPRRLFLEGDILAVYSRLNVNGAAGQTPSAQGCTYGYDCRYSGEGGRTLITLFDVSNPASPTEIRRYELSGGFVAARRVGQFVYTVVHDSGATAPPISVQLTAASPRELEQNYAALKSNVDRTIDGLPAEHFLPWISEQTAAGGQPTRVETCQGALQSASATGMSFVTLVALDLDTLAPPSRTLVAARPGFVYSSADALYLATDGVDGKDSLPSRYRGSAADERSTIHKFTLDGASTQYAGSDWIRGHVLNQFSMDELEGVLRVASSSGYVPDPLASSNVTTLAQVDGAFVRQGELTGLAPQEDIRAVRFDGDQGFIVTFKKTDPLFVIDLGNPALPSVLGELKIPGFSTYMQRLDANHLLAVGFDADDHGDFAYFDGIQVQIFDVTELSKPELLHKTVIGTRGSGSEALLNHLAFNYYGPKKLLGLPMTICEGGDDGAYGGQLTFSGLMVFDVSLDAGVVERGRMPFVDPSAQQQASCGKWWTDSTSMVKRSIFLDNFALGLSDGRLNAAHLSELSNVLATVSLAP